MDTGITGYDVSVVSVKSLCYYSYSIRLATKPAGPGSDYQIMHTHDVIQPDGTVVLSRPKKVSNVPYAERSTIAYDELSEELVIAYQSKDPKNTAIVTIQKSTSPDMGDHWSR